MGAELTAEEGLLKGLILALGEGEEWTIGRDPDMCMIVVEDPKVSRLHLKITKTDEGFVIENLSDSNPVLVNEKRIASPTVLHENDLLTIGSSVFSFYPEGMGSGFEMSAPSAHEDEEFFTEEHPEEELVPEPQEEELEEEGTAEEEIFEEGESSFEPEEGEFFEEPEPSLEAEESEELIETEALFEESEQPQVRLDLEQTTRFILKVIAGPNTGAEFALDLGREYLIGTDATSCDIVFNDLSVSREHARLSVDQEGVLAIQDLNSRNGVLVDRERVEDKKHLLANAVVSLGTSAFLLIDREAPAETITAPVFDVPREEEKEEEIREEVEEEKEAVLVAKTPKKPPFSPGALILALFIGGLAVLFGIGMVSLFRTQEVQRVEKDYLAEIQNIIKDFPGVRFTYNPSSGQLFLMGHVQTGIDLNELLYKIHGLTFIKGVENNIVNDEAVWQEMNILLSKHPEFKGVSMHAPLPGEFVVNGYLDSEKQAAALTDYLNLNFNYINLLKNKVVVEQSVIEEVSGRLIQSGFGAVAVGFTTGDLQLTGYINSTQVYEFEKLVDKLKKISGVRNVRNFVVAVTPEEGVVDLNVKYPGRYRVTGSSKHGDMNINVVINGKILTRGDAIDEYTITSIQPHTIFLERDGLKYKIEYNK